MDPSQLLDNYLASSRKRPFLAHAVKDAPEGFLDELQRRAVRRYTSNTLTLTELKLFAHDLAAVCTRPEAQQLYLAIASTNTCCVRTANVEARERLAEWLGS